MSRKTLTAVRSIAGDDLRGMFIAGRQCVELSAATMNALNVFPVPDGDTGTNMLLTLKAVDEELAGLETASASRIAQAIARGTLMGARGNSGVIISQFFQGFAQGLADSDTIDGVLAAKALASAAEAAYKAVSAPVEGTILTVAREAASSAEAAAKDEDDPVHIWEEACHGARRALAETPDLLPVLKEAGVVDSGGMGLVAFMEGALCHLRGQEVSALEIDVGQAAPAASYLAATEEEEAYGYCTQFLLQGQAMDIEAVRRHVAGIAGSAVVVGSAAAIKVHAHTEDPGKVLSYAVTLGSLSQIKIDNIDGQHQDFLAMHRERQGRRQVAALGVVVVAYGQGIIRVFQELGAVDVIPGGQTMNPSVRDIVDHAAQASASQVIVLPNNPNIVNTARQAAAVSAKPLHVVPTRSISQGVAALLAFNPESDANANLAQMQEAASGVRSGEVTRAIRTTTVGDVRVKEGEAIAMLDDKLIAACSTAAEALQKLCIHAAPGKGALITLYWGGDTREEEAQIAAEDVRSRYPGVEVEVVYGGQPYYDYLVSIE